MPNLWGHAWQQYGTLGAADAGTRRRSIDLCKRAMDIAAAGNCEYVGLWPGHDGADYYFEADYQRMWEWWVEGVRELADHNSAIRIGLEPKPTEPRAFPLINSAAKALLLIQDIGRPNVGVCLDIGHSLYSGENVAEAIALLQGRGNRLFHLHMNDNYNTSDLDMIFGSVHTLEFIEMFYWLWRTGYAHFMSVDLFAYRTDATRSVEQALRWMQAFDAFVDRVGIDATGRTDCPGRPDRSHGVLPLPTAGLLAPALHLVVRRRRPSRHLSAHHFAHPACQGRFPTLPFGSRATQAQARHAFRAVYGILCGWVWQHMTLTPARRRS